MSEIWKVRNKSGQARFVPALNAVVDVDEVVDVPEPLAVGLVSQSIWERVDGTKAEPKKADPKN